MNHKSYYLAAKDSKCGFWLFRNKKHPFSAIKNSNWGIYGHELPKKIQTVSFPETFTYIGPLLQAMLDVNKGRAV